MKIRPLISELKQDRCGGAGFHGFRGWRHFWQIRPERVRGLARK
ncbi:MAG TPA: hypothetical protein VGC13_01245 [Longimicrobium sp.]|jgi:hypothetical protein